MRRELLTHVLLLIGASACVEPRDSEADSAADSVAAAPAYQKIRALDLTGDGIPDTVRLKATGQPADSLDITLQLVVDGSVKHEERWGSSYELALIDSVLQKTHADSLLRVRLDSVLASVNLQQLEEPGVRLMAEDSMTLAGIVPRPEYRVSFSYGYETTVPLVWDAPRARFVRLWSCC